MGPALSTVAVIALLILPAGGALTCQKYTYTYDSSTDCGRLKGQSAFEMQRCAANTAEVETYMTGQNLGKNLDPDQCKLSWLYGCATFPLPGVVVVPKSIVCNKVVCDQSPFFSNCVTDADCAEVSQVEAGLPATGYVWPTSANHSDIPELYRPCCDFYETNCNGAKGPAIQAKNEDKAYTPAERAAKHGLCVYYDKKTPNCWHSQPSA